MACAPFPASSAGWNTSSSVPRQASRAAASSAAAPSRQVTCMSWPQACITGTSAPREFVARPVLAYGKPVCSSTGSPSMSARSSTVGPAPFESTPTTPVPPTPVVTW